MNRGFSLVESLVAVAISTVVGAAMWSLINNAISSSNYFTDRQELDEAMRQAQFIIMKETECPNNIRAPGDQPVSFRAGQRVAIDVIRSTAGGNNSVLLQSNQPFGRIRVGQMTIEEGTLNAEHPVQILYENGNPVPYDVFFTTLNIPATTRDGRPMDRRQIPLKVFVRQGSVTQEISKCYIRHVDNQTCGSFGGIFNEATGTCDMRVCDASTVGATEDCPPSSWTCSERVYFWGFANDPNTGLLGPRCLCTQSCQPPAPSGY